MFSGDQAFESLKQERRLDSSGMLSFKTIRWNFTSCSMEYALVARAQKPKFEEQQRDEVRKA